MPELPEVETIVQGLDKKITGRKIIDVWTDWKKTIKKPANFDLFKKEVIGKKILKTRRRGKNILIYLNSKSKILNSKLLLIHQKLTGHLLYGKWEIKRQISGIGCQVSSLIKGTFEERVNNYIHLIFYLDNGWQIALSDLRKFAKVIVGDREEIEKLPDLADLGPEPLDKDFTFEKFKEILRKKRGKIKVVLMNQNIIAGIGNIYSDEILWFAKVHPEKRVENLSDKELNLIYQAMKNILKESIKLRGDSMSDFRDISGKKGKYQNYHRVYQQTGQPCQRCGAIIKKFKLGGRSGHFCPKCQINE